MVLSNHGTTDVKRNLLDFIEKVHLMGIHDCYKTSPILNGHEVKKCLPKIENRFIGKIMEEQIHISIENIPHKLSKDEMMNRLIKEHSDLV